MNCYSEVSKKSGIGYGWFMKVYLVGGAVRDALLHVPVHERDWVVVGATVAHMQEQGYQQVGKDFPVFLHPETKEEYALARLERKVAPGYKGFVFSADAQVSLQEDLQRRDLTINAIAQVPDTGELIDPYGGQKDLREKYLRHVSVAFVEDPLRVLRLARFAAKFPDFHVHPDTQGLLKQMVQGGELNALVPERKWQEWAKLLKMPAPWRFVAVLRQCGAWSVITELAWSRAHDALLKEAVHCDNERVLLACFAWRQTHAVVVSWLQSMRVPNDLQWLALTLVQGDYSVAEYLSLEGEALYTWLTQLDVWRRPQRFEDWLQLAQIIMQVEGGDSTVQIKVLKYRLQLAQAVDGAELFAQGHRGALLGEKIKALRVHCLQAALP
jgi:tRNA nucleotidyltransferase (CCA-adding enzyme)